MVRRREAQQEGRQLVVLLEDEAGAREVLQEQRLDECGEVAVAPPARLDGDDARVVVTTRGAQGHPEMRSWIAIVSSRSWPTPIALMRVPDTSSRYWT